MTIITAKHVSKQYAQETGERHHEVAAIDDVSLKLGHGEVLAIVGPSGSGKSTLLRLIAGLVQPDSGVIEYDGVNLNEVPLTERGIGMVFQEGALAPHWETGKSVGFFLWLRKREHEVPERVQRISQITGFGLDTLLERKPSQLSGGEKQRIAVARALARDPRVFLFDEPFAHLDAKLRAQARIELRRLLNEFPVTSLFVTHDQIEAVALANKIAVMGAGRIEQVGTYAALYSNPINLFVAEFIGTPKMNLFDGVVQNGVWAGRLFGGFPLRHDLVEGSRVILGVRPEDVRLAQASDDGAMPARVEKVTPFFAERFTLADLIMNGQPAERLHASFPPDIPLAPDDAVSITFNEENLLYFDAGTGTRIG